MGTRGLSMGGWRASCEGAGVDGGPWRREVRASEGEGDSKRGERTSVEIDCEARGLGSRDDVTNMVATLCEAGPRLKWPKTDDFGARARGILTAQHGLKVSGVYGAKPGNGDEKVLVWDGPREKREGCQP
ncbi:hypothetical protein EDB83DRAFT_2323568 [Lactarius deliciosus]|nr:hypothetical protein EDB83DRAFT_2323568 [Lactarius deliciosus]